MRLERRLFSFNSPVGACPVCNGLGVEDRLDPDLLVADPAKTIRQGALVITTPTGYVIYSQVTIDVLDQVCRAHGFDVDTPWRDLTDEQRAIVLNGSDRIRIPYGKHPLESRLRWSGITAKPREEGVYKGILPVMEQILRRSRNRNILRFVRSLPCHACGGARLRPEALSVRFRGLHIGQMSRARDRRAPRRGSTALVFPPAEAPVGDADPQRRCGRASAVLERLGLGHLALDRVSTSLSGGEAQRLRLASQVGADLRGVLYVFDEPSIGLHPSEQSRLLDVLGVLRDRGNTVLVVEHDEETIRRADWVVDIGPGAGEHGGELLFSGPPGVDRRRTPIPGAGRARSSSGDRGAPATRSPAARHGRAACCEVRRATTSQHLDVEFLLGALNVVTGVSGAGKSSLVQELVDRVDAGTAAEARSGRQGRSHRPVADRPDAAVESRHLHRPVRRDPRPASPRSPRPRPAASGRAASRSTSPAAAARRARARASSRSGCTSSARWTSSATRAAAGGSTTRRSPSRSAAGPSTTCSRRRSRRRRRCSPTTRARPG